MSRYRLNPQITIQQIIKQQQQKIIQQEKITKQKIKQIKNLQIIITQKNGQIKDLQANKIKQQEEINQKDSIIAQLQKSKNLYIFNTSYEEVQYDSIALPINSNKSIYETFVTIDE